MVFTKDLEEELDHILVEVARTQNIENFEINPNKEANYGDGFVAQFYTGDIRNKNTGELVNVAIKKAPITSDFNSGIIFKNEDIFYNLIFPALNDLQKEYGVSEPFDNLPDYFCGGMEPNKEYIAMENLKPLGYVMLDKKQYLDREHLEIIFKTYGKFHALSYVLRNNNKEKYDTVRKDIRNLLEQMEKLIDKPITAAISAAIDALDSNLDKNIYDEIKDLKSNVLENYLLAYDYTGEHRCLIHGDCWSNNMLFKYSESGKLLDMKLIDFQLCKDNTPINDLSYFFYSGASKKDMDDLDDYLQIYFKSFSEFAKQLGANPDKIFSYEVLKNEWKENALSGAILGIYLWQIKLIPKEDFEHILTPNEDQQRRSMEESMKLWEVLLDKVHKTDLYRERTTAILRHAFEYGVINKDKIKKKKQ